MPSFFRLQQRDTATPSADQRNRVNQVRSTSTTPRRDPLMNTDRLRHPAPPQAAIPVAGEAKSFQRSPHLVRRAQLSRTHREMGNDERAPPFFFAKHADMIEPDGATIPYPPLTRTCITRSN